MILRPDDMTPFDTWLIARFCTGLEAQELGRASKAMRPLIERMSEASQEDRAAIWEQTLANSSDDAEALIRAVAEANPNDPAPEDDGWGSPELEKRVPVSPFPVEVFPKAVRRLIRESAKSIGCPCDFQGMAVLAVAGAAIGRSASLRLKDDYFASAAFYIAIVAKPGEGKTAALNAVTAPLKSLDASEHKRFQEAMAEYDSDLEGYNSAKRQSNQPVRTRSKGSRTVADDGLEGDEETDVSECLSKPTPPVRPRLGRIVVDDATTESLTLILSENPRGLLVAKDELTALIGSLNQYRSGKGADKQFFLSAWSGSPIVVDRKGNVGGEPIRVEHPHLGVVGGIQPDMLGDLVDSKGRDDGFTDRIVFTYPDPVPKPPWSDEGLSKRTADGWAEIINTIHNQPLAITDGKDCPNVINFTYRAKEAWKTWFNSFRAEQNADDFVDWLRGPWAKLEQYAARIILTLHMLRWASEPRRADAGIPDVEAETVLAAASLVDYLKSHLRRAHSAMRVNSNGNDGDEIAQTIMNWLRRNDHLSFTERDLTRNFPKLGQNPKGLQAALSWLEARQCLRPRETKKEAGRPGRKPSRTFDVNPRLILALEGRDSISQSPPTRSDGELVNSVGIAASSTLDGGREADDVYSPF